MLRVALPDLDAASRAAFGPEVSGARYSRRPIMM